MQTTKDFLLGRIEAFEKIKKPNRRQQRILKKLRERANKLLEQEAKKAA